MKQNREICLIGITGGIGAGKSEILDYMKQHYKCEVYMADEVAHFVKEPGQPCYNKLIKVLGQDVLKADGSIDRNLMAAKIFMDANLLKKVNEIIHPAVKDYLVDAIEKAKEKEDVELVFIEAALLIEAGYKGIVDELWYIHASTTVRERRLIESRGYTKQKVSEIMAKQLSEENFRQESDFVIDNSTTLENAYRQINERLGAYTWQE